MDKLSLLFIWLGASVLLAVLAQTILWGFLRRRSVSINWFFVGTPGYLDAKYVSWCKRNQKNYLAVIILRSVLVLSIIAAVIAIQAAS
ncbi:MAG: hypothetical protein ACRECA_14060 [Pseudolabrys sp.]